MPKESPIHVIYPERLDSFVRRGSSHTPKLLAEGLKESRGFRGEVHAHSKKTDPSRFFQRDAVVLVVDRSVTASPKGDLVLGFTEQDDSSRINIQGITGLHSAVSRDFSELGLRSSMGTHGGNQLLEKIVSRQFPAYSCDSGSVEVAARVFGFVIPALLEDDRPGYWRGVLRDSYGGVPGRARARGS